MGDGRCESLGEMLRGMNIFGKLEHEPLRLMRLTKKKKNGRLAEKNKKTREIDGWMEWGLRRMKSRAERWAQEVERSDRGNRRRDEERDGRGGGGDVADLAVLLQVDWRRAFSIADGAYELPASAACKENAYITHVYAHTHTRTRTKWISGKVKEWFFKTDGSTASWNDVIITNKVA